MAKPLLELLLESPECEEFEIPQAAFNFSRLIAFGITFMASLASVGSGEDLALAPCCLLVLFPDLLSSLYQISFYFKQ